MPSRAEMRRRSGPVGAVIWDAYWREHYTVLSHNEDGTVTVRWHGKQDSLGLDRFPAGRVTTHRTWLRRDDRIVSHPKGQS